MRTTTPHILPGCEWCDNDHDPDITCRCEPESVRFQVPKDRERPVRKPPQPITDPVTGKVIGFRRA